MWTITNQQLSKIAVSMRENFEKRILFQLEKKVNIKNRKDVCDIIHKQIDTALLYEIEDNELITLFVEYSFKYPILQEEKLDETLKRILLFKEIGAERKVQQLINYLKTSNYEPNF